MYMQQSSRFIDCNVSLVCKLKKIIHGFKEAHRAWYEKLHSTLIHFGFISSKCDHSLFIYQHSNATLYAMVYVDDILITITSSKLVHDFISKLHNNWESQNTLSELRYTSNKMVLSS